MTSRLDRLFVLLETGSSAVTRRAAAKQLGEVQKLYPHELHCLLSRVEEYLRNTSWDTRIAAAQAVEAILQNVPEWDPPGNDYSENEAVVTPQSGRLRYESFDLKKILADSAYLMGSQGSEYDLDEDNLGGDKKDLLSRQRELLNSQIGLNLPDLKTDLLMPEDLSLGSGTQPGVLDLSKKNVSEVLQNELAVSSPTWDSVDTSWSQSSFQSGSSGSSQTLSSREINRARRKARQLVSKQRSLPPTPTATDDKDNPFTRQLSFTLTQSTVDSCDSGIGEEPLAKKSRSESVASKTNEDLISEAPVPDVTGSWCKAVDWPLESFVDRLCQGLFNSSWEVRHGSATALRETIKIHGKGAGKSVDMSSKQMEESHQLFLEDISLRLLCVLSLDRFGDFVSDQVVAPVRETCAQALGSILHLMSEKRVNQVLKVLLQLLEQKDWETRHGGLLGLKYLLAVRKDLVSSVLATALTPITNGLSDPVEDVGAVAAAALIPVADTLVSNLPDFVEPIVMRLWDLLLNQDELGAACNSFMGLLASILSVPQSQNCLKNETLVEVIPRLWPFLSHNSSSVRKATLQTFYTLTYSSECLAYWDQQLLQDSLRHIFQRCLVEHLPQIQEIILKVWDNLVNLSKLEVLLVAACPIMSIWLCLTVQPSKIPFDSSLLIKANQFTPKDSKNRRNHVTNVLADTNCSTIELKLYIGGAEIIPANIRENNAMIARFIASKMLGALSVHIVKPAPGVIYSDESSSPVNCFVKLLLVYLNSKSALQRTVTGLVIAEWARLATPSPCPSLLQERLLQCLNEGVYFDEIASAYTKLLQEVRDLVAMLKHYRLPFDDSQYGKVLTLDQIQQLSNSGMQESIKSLKKKQIMETLEERRKSVQTTALQISAEQAKHLVTTQAALAGAFLTLKCLPEKLNPVIKPLMESIKKEKNEHLQHLAATHLSQLIDMCAVRQPCPNTKIINNLCAFLCSDPECTPRISTENENSNKIIGNCSSDELSNNCENRITSCSNSNQNYHGIIALVNRQRIAEKTVLKASGSGMSVGPGRPPKTDIPLNQLLGTDDETQKQNQVQRRGATYAFSAMVSHFGAELPKKLPHLWETMFILVKSAVDLHKFDPVSLVNNNSKAESLVCSLQVLEVTSPSLHSSLLPEVLTLLPHLCLLLTHPYSAVRHLASRCLAALSKINPAVVMKYVIDSVLPYLGASECESKREGAIEAIACILERMQFDIIPYIVFLIVPLLGRMSDQLESVRLMATDCFATLIQLMPLDGGALNASSFSEELISQKEQERLFLEHLFNPKRIPNYEVPVKINCQLRSYQQSGINWLSFLNKYKLHGILCDDMGLGKTLQSICMLAGDHYTRSQQYKLKKSADCAPLPSLVICPPTLTGHWVYEVDKFLSRKYLNPLQYAGPPQERERLRSLVPSHNLIVASYEIVRKDIQFFSAIKWNYCILDEGHIIKNGKTKSSKAIKQLHANHRLILSGTPIQNNVLELWSLFDFLMPGFLGTEKQFNARYSRPILASRDPKSSAKEQEAGVLAMEALHRQVLPFVLRRMKEDVLTDLPPKITQDYYCDLSPLQMQLYEDFSRSQAHQSLTDHIDSKSNANIFQALRYLQNVCNHPKLVVTPEHPEYERITMQLQERNSSLSDIQHAAKLPALQQLLLDCGIGANGNTETPVIGQHRALIFCQLKAMLDILENDLFKTTMNTVSYLRLDGSVPHSSRHSLVTRFNNDPSIDVLLLTTQVGGLGLNLTGADTVIFVEHDWSPMKDLQAMDRAHRIGQKKVVNVYRLITRATLEEKIMGLQKFKLMTANTVISSENASLETMGTDKLLDLFSLGGKQGSMESTWGIPQIPSLTPGSNSSTQTVLDTLPDLWDDKDYEEEYDLTNFVKTLKP